MVLTQNKFQVDEVTNSTNPLMMILRFHLNSSLSYIELEICVAI